MAGDGAPVGAELVIQLRSGVWDPRRLGSLFLAPLYVSADSSVPWSTSRCYGTSQSVRDLDEGCGGDEGGFSTVACCTPPCTTSSTHVYDPCINLFACGCPWDSEGSYASPAMLNVLGAFRTSRSGIEDIWNCLVKICLECPSSDRLLYQTLLYRLHPPPLLLCDNAD